MDITELKREKKIDYSNRHPWEQCRARVISFLLKRYCKNQQNIVDIGSGDGYIAWHLAKSNHRKHISSIDTAYTPALINDLSKSIAAEHIHFYQNLEAFAGAHPPNADAVLLLDVLEHLEKPSDLLQEAIKDQYKLINSVWLVTVPAYQSLFSNHDQLLKHKKRYTTTSISAVLKANGFVVHQSGYFFISLLIVRALKVFGERFFNNKPVKSIDNWSGSPLITAVLTSLLWCDFLVGFGFHKIGIPMPGLSSYTICRPKV